MARTSDHRGQTCFSVVQKNRSKRVIRGRGSLSFEYDELLPQGKDLARGIQATAKESAERAGNAEIK
jgi:hypothetical protein